MHCCRELKGSCLRFVLFKVLNLWVFFLASFFQLSHCLMAGKHSNEMHMVTSFSFSSRGFNCILVQLINNSVLLDESQLYL